MAASSNEWDMQAKKQSIGTKAIESDHAQGEEQQSFPLFNLPPELWIKCCQFAVVESEPIILEGPDNQPAVQALVAQPPITRTCRAIRAETISLFYQANEFRFIDDGQCTLAGLRKWVEALWPSHWSLVQQCTIESQHEDIIEHLCSEFDGFAEVEFDGDAPDEEITKILRFGAKALLDVAREKAGAKDAKVGKASGMAAASYGSGG